MPIHFSCPHCSYQTEVADEYAGQTGPCAKCGQTMTIPPLAGTPGYARPTQGSGGVVVVVVVLLVVLVVAFLFCGGLGAFMFMARTGVGPMPMPPPASMQCSNHLKQIGLALHNYHEVYGTLPPAYVADEDGRPMHSWRVLILPFLEQQVLYDQYDFDEPWDGPNNLALSEAVVDVYRCPDDWQGDGSETSYLMIVGPGTISDGTGATTFADVRDGTSNTIIVVEVAGSGINWAEPRDLPSEELALGIDGPAGGGIRSEHPGRTNVLFCDGSVRSLFGSAAPEELEAAASIAGGEPVDMSGLVD